MPALGEGFVDRAAARQAPIERRAETDGGIIGNRSLHGNYSGNTPVNKCGGDTPEGIRPVLVTGSRRVAGIEHHHAERTQVRELRGECPAAHQLRRSIRPFESEHPFSADFIEGAMPHKVENVVAILGQRFAYGFGGGMRQEAHLDTGGALLQPLEAPGLLREIERLQASRTGAYRQNAQRRREGTRMRWARNIEVAHQRNLAGQHEKIPGLAVAEQLPRKVGERSCFFVTRIELDLETQPAIRGDLELTPALVEERTNLPLEDGTIKLGTEL